MFRKPHPVHDWLRVLCKVTADANLSQIQLIWKCAAGDSGLDAVPGSLGGQDSEKQERETITRLREKERPQVES